MADRQSTERCIAFAVSEPLKQPVDIVELQLGPAGLSRPAAELVKNLARALDGTGIRDRHTLRIGILAHHLTTERIATRIVAAIARTVWLA